MVFLKTAALRFSRYVKSNNRACFNQTFSIGNDHFVPFLHRPYHFLIYSIYRLLLVLSLHKRRHLLVSINEICNRCCPLLGVTAILDSAIFEDLLLMIVLKKPFETSIIDGRPRRFLLPFV